MTSKTFHLFGLQRSGTNYIEAIIRRSFSPSKGDSRKHSFASEVVLGDDDEFVLVVRHPVTWFASCTLHTSQNLTEWRREYFTGTETVGLAKVYSDYVSGWLHHSRFDDGRLLRYEDVLKFGLVALEDFFKTRLDMAPGDEAASAFDQVPMSVTMPETDRLAALEMRCTLDRQAAWNFWQQLDPAVVQRCGYSFEQIAFVKEESLRTVAYRVINHPDTATHSDWDAICRHAETTFAKDGPVQRAIADMYASRGDREQALKHYGLAYQALTGFVRINGGEGGYDVKKVDVIDSMIALLQRERTAVLEETMARLTTGPKPSPIAGLANLNYLISDTANRLGRKEDALAFAYAAIDGDGDGPGNVWRYNHLAILLMERGDFDKAAEALRTATLKDPDNVHFHFSLSDALLKAGHIEAATEAALAATNRNTLVPWHYHHAAELLLRQGRVEEALALARRAAEAEPNNGEHQYLLSCIHEQMRDHDGALFHARAATLGTGNLAGFREHYARLKSDSARRQSDLVE
jgi:tetratricopeptide (TPR) repeat protein